MKKTLALILTCVLALAVLPALADEAAVTGDWYADPDGMPVQLTLAEDGTYTLSVPGSEPVCGAWKLDDGYIYMDGAKTPDMATLGDDTLVMSDGMTFFTREKIEGYIPADPMTDADASAFAGYWQAVYVVVNGMPVPASVLKDQTDLYVEGHSAILGGPRFGDTQVKMTLENGALTCENAGARVTLQIQQDGYLRFTIAAPDATQILYLLRAPTPDDVLDDVP